MIKQFLNQRPNKGIVTTDHPKNWKACFSQLSRHKLLYSVINCYTLEWLVSGSAAHELRFTSQYVSITGTNFLLSHLISFLFSLRHRKYWISLTPPGHQGPVSPILRDPITLRYRKLLKGLAYGFQILCEISKATFDISHKILDSNIAKMHYTDCYYSLWFIISWNCDVINETTPGRFKSSGARLFIEQPAQTNNKIALKPM